MDVRFVDMRYVVCGCECVWLVKVCGLLSQGKFAVVRVCGCTNRRCEGVWMYKQEM